MNLDKCHGWSILLLTLCFATPLATGGAGAAEPPEQKSTIIKDGSLESFMRNVTVKDASISIKAGVYKTADGDLEVKSPVTFTIDPAELVTVKDEPLLLSEKKPESFLVGTRLAALSTYGINGAGSFVPGSLSIRKTSGGRQLVEGKDYLVAPEHAMVGLAPGSKFSPTEPVQASYQYSLLRLDSIVVNAQGQAHLIKGKSHIAIPQPPDLPEGAKRLLNIFRPYQARTLVSENIFPILERPDQVVTRSTRGRIPKTLAKIKASHAVHIICLGDSVTAGGDASRPDLIFSEVFRRALLKKYSPPSPEGVPLVSINITNESYGGTCSSQWLRIGPLKDYIDQHPEMLGNAKERINFKRILTYKPDLVAIEFVNDTPFPRNVLEKLYGKMVRDLHAIGAEVILITPHFCSLEMRNTPSLREGENRAYVQFIYEFADRHNLAVADASARWVHLAKEGIPYTTLLANTLNHPDDRGHLFFAEELMKCFE